MRRLVTASLGRLALTLDRAATVFTYAAGGLLRLDDLERHAQQDWRAFGLGQSEQDITAGLFPWEKDFYLPVLEVDDRILIVGCGSGRDLLALLERGHHVAGLDPVAACVAMAAHRLAARGLRAELIIAPVESAPLTSRFDVFVFSWFCYSYIPLRARRVATLQKLGTLLEPKGRILISYIRAEPPPRRLLWRLAYTTAALSRSDWRPEYGDVFVARHDSGCLHFEHRFRPEELEAEAAAAGLAVASHDTAGDGNAVLVRP